MKKYLQNKVAESRLTLPAVAAYALVVWLLSGLVAKQWWLQFGCFAIATYLMVELNNINALIRIYSRMVSCTFLLLGCCACFLFPSLRGALLQICFIGSIIVLFQGYQDKQSVGFTYYGFLLLGLASMIFVHIIFFVPPFWILMITHLQSLSWRTLGASFFGLLTPYWFGICWLFYTGDFTLLFSHFAQLAVFQQPFHILHLKFQIFPDNYAILAVFTFLIILAITGTIHYIRQHQGDKIRIRLLYGFFIWTDIVAIIFLLLQPQHYDSLLRIIIVCTAPLVAHFLALTSTKVTNVAFCIITVTIVFLTAYSLWTASSIF